MKTCLPYLLRWLLLFGTFSSLAACHSRSQAQGPPREGKIPLQAANWYQLNNIGDEVKPGTGLQQLSDGNLDQEVFMGWSKVLPHYDCYYEFKDLADVSIASVRFYDGDNTFADKPFKLYAKASAAAAPVLLATFTGDTYGQWVEVTLPKPVPARYLVANVWQGFPRELELYGTCKKAPAPALA
ncbi:MAG: hypothetical protein EOO62_10865, partial [Hymenobacter sp.]